MAGKKFSVEDKKDEFKDIQESTKPAEKTNKKAGGDYIRLDLKPFGYDLKEYVNRRCGELSAERDRKVSSTAFIQELIIADMENYDGTTKKKEKKKETKKEKIMRLLEEADESKLNAIFTLLDIQL